MCDCDGPLSAHKHGGAYKYFDQKDKNNFFWDGIRKYWDQQEDITRLNGLKKTVDDKPWLLPVVIILLFACILVVIRVYRRSCAKEHKERASSNKQKQSKSAKSAKGKKRHYDASGGDADADEQGVFATDEDGNLTRRKDARGRAQKLREQIDFEINGPHRKLMSGGREEADVEEVCNAPHCKGACGKYHNVSRKQKKIEKNHKKARSKNGKSSTISPEKAGKKVQFAKGKVEKPAVPAPKVDTVKQEALVNGVRFDPTVVAHSIGRAVVNSGSVVSQMCFTFALNGIILCAHIFKDGGDTVSFKHAGKSVDVKKSKSKSIGNDLLWFPRPEEFKEAKMLRCAVPIVGSKIQMIAFDNEEDLKSNRFKLDSGVVKVIQTANGAEKAYATYSSVDGNCSAPVVTPDGKVVGFHNATTSNETVFIPITTHVVELATGSHSTF
jgi:hypothetical protein